MMQSVCEDAIREQTFLSACDRISVCMVAHTDIVSELTLRRLSKWVFCSSHMLDRNKRIPWGDPHKRRIWLGYDIYCDNNEAKGDGGDVRNDDRCLVDHIIITVGSIFKTSEE